MGRRKKRSHTLWSFLPGWEPLPQPRSEPEPASSQEFLAWLLPRLQRGEAVRQWKQWVPVPEWGWCEWCPNVRHLEADCCHTGPDLCCCCVVEEEIEDLLANLGRANCGGRFPPAPPLSGSYAGPVAGPASPGPAPGPLPAPDPPRLLRPSAVGSVSWWGECGDDGGGVGPEEDPADDPVPDGDEEAPAANGGTKGPEDPRPPEPANPTVPPDSPGGRERERGAVQEPSGDTAPEDSATPHAAAPVATRTVGSVPTRAAAPSVTPESDPAPSGGPAGDPGPSTPAAPPTVPECGPGGEDPAAPLAAEESGPKIFGGVTPAGGVGIRQAPASPTPSAQAQLALESRASPAATHSPARGPSRRSVTAPRRHETACPRAGTMPGPLREKGGRKTLSRPPPSSLASWDSAPATQRRLTFDPGGWMPRGGDCDVRRRGMHRSPAPHGQPACPAEPRWTNWLSWVDKSGRSAHTQGERLERLLHGP